MKANFQDYARYYDVINADKPYAEEAAYVASVLRKHNPKVSTILELGSGTGRHGRLIAARGMHVCGVERSADMAELVPRDEGASEEGSFNCQLGDIRAVRLGRVFDAVVSLFHVVSYQVSDLDVVATFETASSHLSSGGLFLFDVWHGPAVLFQRPEVRIRKAKEGDLVVVRKARPELRAEENVVLVDFDFSIERGDAQTEFFSERHAMRYFFPEEIVAATDKSFIFLSVEEMVSGAVPSEHTWAVTYLLQKR